MPPLYGALTPIKNINKVERRAARWVTHDYSSYSSVTQMINTLGWMSLEQRRADARLIMFYKIVHGLVEIPLPSYIHRQVRMTRTTHPYHFIQIQTTANYYKSTSRQRSGKGAIRKRFPLHKPRWEKTKLTIRYLYHENISQAELATIFPIGGHSVT